MWNQYQKQNFNSFNNNYKIAPKAHLVSQGGGYDDSQIILHLQ
jgi:hypothetical protein